MTTGVIADYDTEKKTGHIAADEGDDLFPFDGEDVKDVDVAAIREGLRVTFRVEGGMAGVYAKEIRRRP